MSAPPDDCPNNPSLRLDAVTIALIIILILANVVLAADDARSTIADRDRLQLTAEPAGALDVLAARAKPASRAPPGVKSSWSAASAACRTPGPWRMPTIPGTLAKRRCSSWTLTRRASLSHT